jgi:hypothetical protein
MRPEHYTDSVIFDYICYEQKECAEQTLLHLYAEFIENESKFLYANDHCYGIKCELITDKLHATQDMFGLYAN